LLTVTGSTAVSFCTCVHARGWCNVDQAS